MVQPSAFGFWAYGTMLQFGFWMFIFVQNPYFWIIFCIRIQDIRFLALHCTVVQSCDQYSIERSQFQIPARTNCFHFLGCLECWKFDVDKCVYSKCLKSKLQSMSEIETSFDFRHSLFSVYSKVKDWLTSGLLGTHFIEYKRRA